MGANRITNEGGITDFRLALERLGNRVVSVLSLFDDAQGSVCIRWENEPDWGIVADGLAVLQNPVGHPGETVDSLGMELGRAAFGPEMLSTLVGHLEAREVRIWLRPTGDLANLPWETCTFGSENGVVEGALSMHPGL